MQLLLLLALGQAAPPAEELDDVVVTAARTAGEAGDSPYATTVLDAQQIHDGRPTLSLGEALAQVPGVYVTSRYNFTQDTRLSIRGFGARSAFGIRGVRVLLDGIPLTLPDGQSQIDSIDMAAVGRVELLRGPASSLYGNAAGGVLALSTREPLEGVDLSWTNYVGAFGLWKTAAHGRTKIRDTGVSVFASRTRFDGFRAQAGAEQVNVMARVTTKLSARLRWAVNAHYVRAPRADDPGGLTAAQVAQDRSQAAPNNLRFATGEDVSQLQVGSRVQLSLSRDQRLELVAHGGVRTFEGAIPFRFVDFDRDFYGAQLLYRWDGRFGPVRNRLVTGLEVQGQQDSRTNEGNADGVSSGALILDQDESALGLGAYVQDKLTLWRDWEVTGSLRYDTIDFSITDRFVDDGDATGSRTFEQVTAQAGGLYRIERALHVFANVSQSFETPTFTELVNTGDGGGVTGALDPQRALSVEGGARLRGRWYAVEASGYWIRLADEILAREDAESRTVFTNIGASRRFGAEVYARMRLHPTLELLASYTWLRAEFRDDARAGLRLPGIPEHRAFTRARWAWRGLHVAAEAEIVGARFADDANEVADDLYVLGELRAGMDVEVGGGVSGDLTVGVRNLFDADYADNLRVNAFGGRYFEPAPPRHVYAALALCYGAD